MIRPYPAVQLEILVGTLRAQKPRLARPDRLAGRNRTGSPAASAFRRSKAPQLAPCEPTKTLQGHKDYWLGSGSLLVIHLSFTYQASLPCQRCSVETLRSFLILPRTGSAKNKKGSQFMATPENNH